MNVKIGISEKASLDRPAWTSTIETGNQEAYKHLHTIRNGRFVLIENYFEKTKGLLE